MMNLQCLVPLANVMKEPSHRAELHTQMLLGDQIEMLEEAMPWCRVKLLWDGYEGWVLRAQLGLAAHETETRAPYLMEPLLVRGLGTLFPGTSLLAIPEDLRMNVDVSRCFSQNRSQAFSAESVRELLQVYLGVPYMWGGNSTAGIDCSGLSQMLYRFFGIALPHEAAEQMNLGRTLDFVQEAKPGDLAFFANAEGDIVHVGIVWGEGELIHASESNGKVCIDALDQQGIWLKQAGSRSRVALRLIRRLVD
jgi:hypothetical protein